MSSCQSAAESGMVNSGVDLIGNALHPGVADLVILVGVGTMGCKYSDLDVHHRLGLQLQRRTGTAKGK